MSRIPWDEDSPQAAKEAAKKEKKVEKLKTDSVSQTAKKIQEPFKAIPQASRRKIIGAAQQLKRPSPWRKRFEILTAAIAIAVLALKAIGPKNTEQ